MEAAYLSGVLLNPVALGVLLLIVVAITSFHYRSRRQPPSIRARRLLPAYLSALLACAVVSAVMSYVSPEEAWLKWKVLPENYWDAQLKEFFTTFAFAAYAGLLGIAVVGLPVMCALGRRGLATIPHALIAAAVISILVSALLTATDTPPLHRFIALAKDLVPGHLFIAAAFCVGAGMPWRSAPHART